MEILIISNMYPSKENLTYGIFVKNFESGILDNGAYVHKAVIKGRGKNISQKLYKYFKYFFEVIWSVLIRRYDLVYVHYISHSLLPLVLIHRFLTKPLVINAHGSDVFSDRKLSKLIQLLVKPIVRHASLVVVPSDYFKKSVSENFNIDKDKIFVSPSGGINTDLFKKIPVVKDHKFPVLGFVSRIDEGKGWDVFLDSIKKTRALSSVSFKVVIIGGGAQAKQLKDYIQQNRLAEIVDYKGLKAQAELPFYFSNFDAFIFPTVRLAESLGLVGLEAMACGVPVIGSDIGGLKGYINDGVNGFLFEPGNSDDLSDKIVHFLSLSEREKNKLSQNALITSREYDSHLVNKALFDKLSSLVNKRFYEKDNI